MWSCRVPVPIRKLTEIGETTRVAINVSGTKSIKLTVVKTSSNLRHLNISGDKCPLDFLLFTRMQNRIGIYFYNEFDSH